MRDYPMLRLLLVLVAIWFVGALILRFTEGPVNEDFRTLADSFWNITVYLFSGLERGMPETVIGRLTAAVVLILSVGVVAVLTGTIASFLIEGHLARSWDMPAHDLKGHIVLANWNGKAVPIIREMHAAILRDRRPIVIVSEADHAGELPEEVDDPAFHDVYLVKGDPANETILKRANVHLAHTVVVLADPNDGELADAKSILICMAIRSLCNAQGVAKTHVCVEGVAARNVDHLRRAEADEIVAASDFTTMLLAQSALAHGLGTVYRSLLTISGDSNEIYIVPVPAEFHGKSFHDLAVAVLQQQDPENPSILIGVRHGEEILINPAQGRVESLGPTDSALLISLEPPRVTES